MIMLLRCVGKRGTRAVLLASIVAIAASLGAVETAEARGKKKHFRKSQKAQVTRKATGGYSPPFAAMVVDANSGRMMYGVDETEPRHPASVTKVMTLYMLFEQLERGTLSLDSELRVSARAAAMAPSKLGFRPARRSRSRTRSRRSSRSPRTTWPAPLPRTSPARRRISPSG
jgi:D-alanyl-D-alanine carboxypeptidase